LTNGVSFLLTHSVGLKLNPADNWETANVSLSWRSDWETKRESLSYININGTVMYYNVNSGEPASYNIDTWGAWESAEPTFIGFDSFNVTVETSSSVPIPGAILLFGSGLLCIAGVNRKKE